MPKPIFPLPIQGASREFTLILDALEHLIGAAHVHYGRMQATARQIVRMRLWEIEETELNELRDAARVTIFADTGGLIGTVHRLRLLLRRLPGDADTRLARESIRVGGQGWRVSSASLGAYRRRHSPGGLGWTWGTGNHQLVVRDTGRQARLDSTGILVIPRRQGCGSYRRPRTHAERRRSFLDGDRRRAA